MTWADILALDEHALNLALEAHIAGHCWESRTLRGYAEPWWLYDQNPATYVRTDELPSYTRTWNGATSLAWEYGVMPEPAYRDGTLIGYVVGIHPETAPAQKVPAAPASAWDAWAIILACFQTPGRRVDVYEYATRQWQPATVVGAALVGRQEGIALIRDGEQMACYTSVHDVRISQ